MKNYSQYITFIFTLLSFWAQAQINAVVQEPENIKSIVVRSTATNSYSPIVRLGERLLVEFEDLNSTQEEYSYKIEHCDYNWKPSGLVSTEFIDGYDSDIIRDYENSFNTLQPYTHYRFLLPNKNTRLKISGNYLLSILDEDYEVVFTRPFIVYQSKVAVGVSVHRNRELATINSKQNIQFTINHSNILINNPSREIKVAIYQNNDWNSVIKNIKPQFYRGTQLLYKYGKETSFWAGNEYLYFDTKDIRNATNNIRKVVLKDVFNTYLYTHEERIDKPYTLFPDVNGNFVIRSIDVGDTQTEADYSWVHFALESFEDIGDDSIYIYGNYNGWQLTEANKLSYDEDAKLYTGKLLLKQGFYNFNYVTVSKEGKVNNHAIEGSFYQTENEYTVLVYYKPVGSRYTQVIGYGKASSEYLRN